MKQYQIINAYSAMDSFANLDLMPDEHWAIYQLRKQLRPHVDFQIEREQALSEKYKEFADEKGRLMDEKANEFLQERDEINNMDVEIEIEKPKIRLVKGISFAIAEQLEDFIEFIHE